MKIFHVHLFFCFSLLFLLASCSSAPKGPQYRYNFSNEAAELITLAQNSLRIGDERGARSYYREAYRLYTLVDNAEGRIRAIEGLSLLGEEACSKEENAELALRIAREKRDNSGVSGNPSLLDRELEALAELIGLRLELYREEQNGEADGEAGGADETQEAARTAGHRLGNKEIRQRIHSAAEALNKRPQDRARALRLEAEFLIKEGEYSPALGLLEQSLKLFSSPLAFIEYANTRYLMASVQSKMGNLDLAYSSLLDALEHDRHAENGRGLAETCHALALVSRKQGKEELAERWERRSLNIYESLRIQRAESALQSEPAQVEEVPNI